jgi:hypothetical protein
MEEIVNRWPFRKGVDHGKGPGLHLHYTWPRGKPGGPTRASRSIKLARAQARSSLMRTTEVGLPWARDMESLRQLC